MFNKLNEYDDITYYLGNSSYYEYDHDDIINFIKKLSLKYNISENKLTTNFTLIKIGNKIFNLPSHINVNCDEDYYNNFRIEERNEKINQILK